jgi:Zn-dependent protease with chaperone function
VKDFFAQQEAARRSSRRLMLVFAAAVLGTILAVDFVVSVAALMFGGRERVLAWPFHAWTMGVTFAMVALPSWIAAMNLCVGGENAAYMMGADRIRAGTLDPDDIRFRNVVEEMAIASGTAVPQMFVMERQNGINAFVAGFSPSKAAIVVTRGLLRRLNRDELQGVVAHEFSHILNGDMRLNTRLLALVSGLLVIPSFGQMLVGREKTGFFLFVFFGWLLIVVGALGIVCARAVKASVSHQREFLADAASVQFTRNPDGIGGALAKIATTPSGSSVTWPQTEALSHMFFGNAVGFIGSNELQTHPPVMERLRRIYGARVDIDEIVSRSGTPRPVAPAASRKAALPSGAAEAVALAAAVVEAASRAPLDTAAQLLSSLPQALRDGLRESAGARRAMLALVLAPEGAARQAQDALLREAGEDVEALAAAASGAGTLPKVLRLPLIELALPALEALPSGERVRFLALIRRLVELQQRVGLEDFVLVTLLDAAMGERAGRSVPVKFHSLEPLAEDVRIALSIMAHASEDPRAAFARGAHETGLALQLLPAAEVRIGAVVAALERLNQLAPLLKPRLLKGLRQSALADGRMRVAEAELLRAVAAALDSPLPPAVEPKRALSGLSPETIALTRAVEAYPLGVDPDAYLMSFIQPAVREVLAETAGARRTMLALVLAPGGPAREAQDKLLHDDEEDALAIAHSASALGQLPRVLWLPLVELATPALEAMPPSERARFLALLQRLIEADARVTIEEFVLATLLGVALGERAAPAASATIHALEPLAEEVRIALTLVAHGTDDPRAAFARGARATGLELQPAQASAIRIGTVRAMFERLNRLSPMLKPVLMKALARCALADGRIKVAAALLLRAFGTALDSPLPPLVDPTRPAAQPGDRNATMAGNAPQD